MAALNILVVAALVLAVGTSLIGRGLVEAKLTKHTLSPAVIAKSRIRIWKNCAMHVTEHCGHEILDSMTLCKKGASVTKNCCNQLVKMGLNCHILMTNMLEKEFSATKDKILKSSFGTWENCLSQIAPSPAPSKH
ncbi:Prolamin like domain-containing protein [Abeliophyllum distichum]|uniref:Prolamin like domain-containing protein n=1 Tax=Abeliophyllum distichum TaxID=126358 RepID=A0ABD1R9K0_9LAMI